METADMHNGYLHGGRILRPKIVIFLIVGMTMVMLAYINMGIVDNFSELSAAESGLPSYDPNRTSGTLLGQNLKTCTVRGGAGKFLGQIAFRIQPDCQVLCDSFST